MDLLVIMHLLVIQGVQIHLQVTRLKNAYWYMYYRYHITVFYVFKTTTIFVYYIYVIYYRLVIVIMTTIVLCNVI